MSEASQTPSTVTHTSLKDRPTLRLVLQSIWVAVVLYVIYTLTTGASLYFGGLSSNASIIQQITRIGMNLFTFSAIDIGSDLYILLGYFGLAMVIFIHRSDDWFAIFLSLMIMTFGIRLTGIASTLAVGTAVSNLISPIIMMGEAGIVLFGWLYPDGQFIPRWTKYLVPILVLTLILIYWPVSPFYLVNIGMPAYLGISMFWYLASIAGMIHRYRSVSNPNQKQQIRWAFTGSMGPLLWFVMFNLPILFIPTLQDSTSSAYTIYQIVMRALSIFLFLVFPASLTIVIARYKLFDIDFLINRAIVYGALTVILASIFALVLIVDTAMINYFSSGQHTTIGLTISAIAAGALFQPARKALQRFVDRTFYNIKIDYLKTPHHIKGINNDTTTQAPILFSKFNNLALIGKGGMAEVYRAEHPTTNRTVAIKVLLSNLAEDEQYRKRFQREAQTLAALEHKNIVKIYDFGEENHLYYMVMEYLNGPNLSTLLKQKGKIPFNELMPIMENVADALDHAHQAGLVHRDVKPSNVMMDTTQAAPRAVLTDFGIVKLSTSLSNITASAVLGTFDYIAPEQIQAAVDVDGRADIYALGVMTYQMLTGSLPFKRNSPGAVLLAHMTSPAPDAREIVPDLSRHTALAIQKAMAKNPTDRFVTAREFFTAMIR